MFYSHICFLDRFTAGPNQYLRVTHNDGSLENIKGPITTYLNPVLHKDMTVGSRRELTSNKQHIVVFSSDTNTFNTKGGGTRQGDLEKKIISGPTTFMPEVNDRVKSFKWTSRENKFEVLNEDHTFESREFKVKTTEGAESTVKLTVELKISNIPTFVDCTDNDLHSIMMKAIQADIVEACDCKWHEIDGFMKAFTVRGKADRAFWPKFNNLNNKLEKIGAKATSIIYLGSTASADVVRRHNEVEAKAESLACEENELLRNRSKEKERQRMELENIKLQGKIAETKVEQERQRIEAQQELERVKINFKAEMKKKKDAAASEAVKSEGDETIRFLKELKSLDVDIGKLLHGAKCGVKEGGVSGLASGFNDIVRNGVIQELVIKGGEQKDDINYDFVR